MEWIPPEEVEPTEHIGPLLAIDAESRFAVGQINSRA